MKSVLSLLALTLSIFVFSRSSFGQTQLQPAPITTSKNTSSLSRKEKEEKNADIDGEITNARLRAETGAKKKLSFSSAFTYVGASLANPFKAERPQLGGSDGPLAPSRISGSISMKYKPTQRDSFSLNAGVAYNFAFTHPKTGPQPAKSTLSEPSLSYGRAMRVGEIQHVFGTSITKYTLPTYVDAEYDWSINVSHTVMMEVGELKKFSFGFITYAGHNVFTGRDLGDVPNGKPGLSVGLYPVFEYAFTETLYLRTVNRLYVASLKGGQEKWYENQMIQSLGIGLAITRDIYIYPHLQWQWNHIAADFTNVSISTNISL